MFTQHVLAQEEGFSIFEILFEIHKLFENLAEGYFFVMKAMTRLAIHAKKLDFSFPEPLQSCFLLYISTFHEFVQRTMEKCSLFRNFLTTKFFKTG